MAKNENGIPISSFCTACCTPCASGGIVGGVTGGNQNGNQNGNNQSGCNHHCGNQNGNQNGNNQNGGNQNGGVVGGIMDGGCGGRGDCIDLMPLAYVYAPDQRFRMLYSAKDALAHGTLFEELYKPMGVYGNE